jgi:Asp-tRNA(Asn)/Glu-tRNA(Gln) amidotransferase A subunit family amidase
MTSDAQGTLPNAEQLDVTRRRFLTVSTAAGLGGTLFPGALFALSSSSADAQSPAASVAGSWPAITSEMIDAAAAIAAIKLTPEQRQTMLTGLAGQRSAAVSVRELHLPNSVVPTDVFNPVPAGTPGPQPAPPQPVVLGPAPSIADISASQEEKVAFATIRQLGELMRQHKTTSVELTKLYLARLKRYDPMLHFVINLTEERALAQAAAADRELAAGNTRGPLHGIPWGAKDLLAVKGYPTTWGAGGMENQTFDEDAEVVKRLDAAGAVLIAKLTMGALAQGDLWGYAAGSGKPGDRTRNPWNPQQGSSGSSAGPGSATSAGCVGFSIGTETQGSISSPSTRCGVTGLRPSFGLVPRTGAMALVWSMDKIGPITRSVEDCALVLNAIYGPDGRDQSMQPAPFHADLTTDVRGMRIGYIESAFKVPTLPPLSNDETKTPSAAERSRREQQNRTNFERNAYDAKFNTRALETLRGMGLHLTPVEMPDFDFSMLRSILSAESAAAFDELTISGRDALLSGQKPGDWPNQFRVARFLTAVDYIQAMRARARALTAMHQLFADFDVIVTPSSGIQLAATNLCGQPAVIVPNGLRGPDAPPFVRNGEDDSPNYGGPGTPVSLTFLAPLFQDAKAVAVAHAYQMKTGFQLLHPKLA